jgi:hypothetical protein
MLRVRSWRKPPTVERGRPFRSQGRKKNESGPELASSEGRVRDESIGLLWAGFRVLRVRRSCAMRQIGDLLVWFVVVMVLAGVVYFTPKVAQYVSAENRPVPDAALTRGLAFNPTPLPDDVQ